MKYYLGKTTVITGEPLIVILKLIVPREVNVIFFIVTFLCYFAIILRLRYSPLIVVTSCLDDKQKKTLKSNIRILGKIIKSYNTLKKNKIEFNQKS